MEMPFGKHQGVSVDYLPDSYLAWLVDNEKIESSHPDLIEVARTEMKIRLFGGRIVMPFGIHKGKRFWDLPDTYLRWIEERMDQTWLRAAAAAELATRAREAEEKRKLRTRRGAA